MAALFLLSNRSEMAFTDQIDPIKEAALQALQAADSLTGLDDVRVQYLGTNGQFTGLLKQMGNLSKEERPAAGKAVNQAKVELTETLNRRREELELAEAAPKHATDFTARADADRWAKNIRSHRSPRTSCAASARSASPSPMAPRSRRNTTASTRSTPRPITPLATRRTHFSSTQTSARSCARTPRPCRFA